MSLEVSNMEELKTTAGDDKHVVSGEIRLSVLLNGCLMLSLTR